MAAIETTALTKRFGDVTGIADLDLTVEDGEAFGFLGPNGAGKSTTINLLLGFISATDGTASVLGYDVATESKAIRRRIGVLAEGTNVYENLTGRDHVESAIRMKDGDDDPESKLEYVGLAPDDWDRPAGDYSKGMRQRLGLAMALVGDPDLLILDEPSSGLDPTGIQDVRTITKEQVEAGRTVFFSSHILAEVEAVCERVGIMSDGRLAAIDDVSRLAESTGAGARVKLHVESVPADLDLGGLPGVADVTIDSSTVHATCTDPTAKMAVIRRVDRAAEVLDVVAEETSLESVFNSYASESGSIEESA